ncbi:hypothetical protein BGZ98_001461 [Dissophora globulifera]|nr:hypothetical protein BGZ98_001461 [Dissophora globulifera]
MSNVHGGDEDEEEDYMSEAFLSNLVQESESDKSKKASLSYSERRRHKQLEHLANLPKPLHVREKEAREKGLEKEIGEENKGMAMLLKMGFKKGGTLGATKESTDTNFSSISDTKNSSFSATAMTMAPHRSDALTAPLAIQIKQGRGGLGMDSLRKRQAEEEMQKHHDEGSRVFDVGYRGQKRDQFELEKRKRQLSAARAICMRMDAASTDGSAAHANKDTRGDGKAEHISKNSAGQKDSWDDKLEGSRSNSFWWIADSMPDDILGTKLMGPGASATILESGPELGQRAFDRSDDEDGDLVERREKRIKLDPMLSLEDHESDVVEDEESPAMWGERPDFAQLEIPEKLERVVYYLRDKYAYCFWCSAKYDGPDDLTENCPGESEDDH